MRVRRFLESLLTLLLAIITFSAPAQTDIIVDNTSPQFRVVSGSWFPSANAGFYGTNSLISSTNSGGVVEWRLNITQPGVYNVSAWWVASGNRPAAAAYSVRHRSGTTPTPQDQRTNTSTWMPLGAFEFEAAGDYAVQLSTVSATGDFVSADAVRATRIGDLPTESCPGSAGVPTILTGSGGCSLCQNRLLPGAVQNRADVPYYIHSDLPEQFRSHGVLYSTDAVLPADTSTTPIPLNIRTQTAANGFTTIDDSFDIFIFHINRIGSTAARIVIHVRNEGTGPVDLDPRQVIITEGIIGTVHQMESTLGTRVLAGNWDQPVSAFTLQPGESAIVGYSKRFGDSANTSDRSTNINCFGQIRTLVSNSQAATNPTNLRVAVVAIPGAAVSQNLTLAEQWRSVGALEGETLDMTTAPTGCDLRRATGVFRNFVWRSNAPAYDISQLTTPGWDFQMALPQIQSTACPIAQQTTALVLYPGFTRPDTVGNYMIEYRVDLTLQNRNASAPRAFDVGIIKTGADIGLGYQMAVGLSAATDSALAALAPQSLWAGPNQSSQYKSLLGGNAVTLMPCETRVVSLRFLILGNASLPFQLRVAPATPVVQQQPDVWTMR